MALRLRIAFLAGLLGAALCVGSPWAGSSSGAVLVIPVPRLPAPPAGPFLPLAIAPHYGQGIGAGRDHPGQDLFAPLGAPELAVSPAVVLDTGTGYSGGRGNYVSIYDRKANRTYNYFHMEVKPMVHPGQHVEAGQQVGELGCSGSCDGRHLHFEMRSGRDEYGPVLDPAPFLHTLRLAPRPDLAMVARLR